MRRVVVKRMRQASGAGVYAEVSIPCDGLHYILVHTGRRTPRCGLTTSHPFAGGDMDPFFAMHDERPACVSRHPRRLYTNKQRQWSIVSRIECFNIADVD
ncbi:hypothetical protein NDU88_007247 [Pleurodeles waltl]|uniref:Uncharacterized protein n=1 Tax=Pleurodeles waltl TaxID=8319 RepID=A0AAV7SS62_PLEWA|nr:hypothetical protein NDU88_007247 [Pleurodeles waltl]